MLGVSLPHSLQQLIFLILGLVGIGLLITVHELGHFLFCKLFSVRTPTFSIGFGPKLFSKKIGDTEFALSAIPLGGYVEIAGSAEMGQGEQKDAHSTDKHSFANKPWYQKVIIMLGGISFNLIFAYLVMIILFMVGIPSTKMLYPANAKPIIAAIEKGSPAEKAGLALGDNIVAVDGAPLDQNVMKLFEAVGKKPNLPINLSIKRGEQALDIPIALGEQKTPLGKTIGSLGVVFTMVDLPSSSFLDSIKKGFSLSNLFIVNTLLLFKHIFTKGDTKNVGGAVMIISETMKSAEQGIKIWFLLLAIFSLNLAVLNLLPLPILDGGQVLFITIEGLMRRPIPLRIKEYIQIASWLAMLLLMFYLVVKDIFTLAKLR